MNSAPELLSWEDLGAQPAGRAFRRSMGELLCHPASFFHKMALTGGLHEPVTFFSIVLAAVIVLAFPTALAYLAVMQPDPVRMAPGLYARYVLAAQGTGLALVLLPVTLAAGAGTMVLLGTVFHLAGEPFGARNHEGSLSIWFYSAAAALVPPAAALGLLLLVSLAGCLAGLPPAVAHWTLLVGGGAAALAGAALLLGLTTVGCAEAFELEPVLGTAAAFCGALAAAAVAAAGVIGLGWLAACGAFALAGLAVAALRRGGE
jgi:hypothetical protein